MCQDCGCSLPRGDHHHHQLQANPQLNDKKTLSVIHKILDKNDVEAAHNRAHFEAQNEIGRAS